MKVDSFGSDVSSVAVNDISVLSLNVFHEGYTFESAGISPVAGVGNTIIKSMADVIALPEIDDPAYFNDLLAYLNNADGDADIDFHGAVNGSTATISKYELLESKANGDAGGVTSVVDLDGDGKVSAGDFLFNGIHANYTDYANYLPRGYNPGSTYGAFDGSWDIIDADGDGKPDPVVDLELIRGVNLNSGRTAALQQVADAAKDYPFLTSIIAGDFNEASHLDWTEDTKNLFDHNGVSYAWDTSKLLADYGYSDSFREMFPDEVKNPGFTWVTPVETGDHPVSWTPAADERDRIDFIYHLEGEGQTVRTISSTLFGNGDFVVRNELVDGGSGNDASLDIGEPWFTDHEGVLTRYEILTPTQVQSGGPGKIFTGGWHDDKVAGSKGDDLQYGGWGDDRLAGSGGADWMFGGAGSDTADYAKASANLWISLDGNAGSGDLAAGDRLFGVENVRGGARHDRITGDGQANKLFGNSGDDRLDGAKGNDKLDGGADDDRLDGGAGNDTLIGGAGHDWLSGGAGNDDLTAGTGIDVMWGGAGRDIFRFISTADSTVAGRDSVMDFSHRQADKLDFSGIDADGRVRNGDSDFHFVGVNAFSGVRGELHTVAEADSLRVEGDINGDGAADFSVLVAGLTSLHASDFIV